MPELGNPFLGRWRIQEMECWDREYLDLVVPAFIEFEEGRDGSFQFGTVRGGLDHGIVGRLFIHGSDDSSFRAVRGRRGSPGRTRGVRRRYPQAP